MKVRPTLFRLPNLSRGLLLSRIWDTLPSTGGLLICIMALLAGCGGRGGRGGDTAKSHGSRAPRNDTKSENNSADNASANYSKPAKEEDLPMPFGDWPAAKPDLVLALSGEMNGYLRPCGCSAGQHGGLPRRGGFLRYLRETKGWPVLALDLGDLVNKSGDLEKLRYEYALASLAGLNYKAIGVGVGDLKVSLDAILGQAANLSGSTLLTASLRHRDEALQELLQESVKNIVVLEEKGISVALGCVIDDDTHNQLPDGNARLEKLDSATEQVVTAMGKTKVDLKILLAHVPVNRAHLLAATHSGFDMILCSSKYEDSSPREAKMIDKTLVAWVGQKGKSLGVVGFWKQEKPRLRFDVVALDKRFSEDESMNELYGRFVETIQRENFLAKVPKQALTGENGFVGAARCGTCHTKAHAFWKNSKHSHALESLTKAKPLGQDYNPECLSCHTTGFAYRGGFESRDRTPLLGGNQCENCHGPGKAHSEKPKDLALIQAMRRSKTNIESTCVTCHDLDNSPHFKFDLYWPKIAHPWKD